MAFKYIGNISNRTFDDHTTYRYPQGKHPHAEFFDNDLKTVLGDIF